MKIKPNHFQSLKGTKEIIRKDGKKYTIRSNRQRFFFPDEWLVFEERLNSNQQLTFRTLINTGARIMEAQNIKVSDIDFDRKNIVLRVTKRILKNPKKGAESQRKIRVLTISTQFAKYLKKQIKLHKLGPDDLLPILSTPAAHIALKKHLREIGIKDWEMISIHNIRKTLETWLIALNIDSFKVTKHFGHSFAIAAQHYVSPDIFNYDDKVMMREIIGDLFKEEPQRF